MLRAVSTIPENFLAWAENSSRTVEERYGILRLIEYVYDYHYRGTDKVQKNYEADRLMREDRRFNAAYVPVIDPALLRITAGLLPGVHKLALDHFGEERPIRDLSFLAFMPQLLELKLRDVEMDRLEALRHLPALREFNIRTDGVEDYRDLSACRELREIHIQTWHPWPVLTGIETLPHLEALHWLGNGRSLADIPVLPVLKRIRIDWAEHHSAFCNCVRDLHQLPEMPLLEYLWGGWFYRLDGVERYPRLRIVCIKGYFKNLAPLAGLPAVTHLRVVSPNLTEVATIAAMPSVFQFALRSIRPQDWGPLFESTTLREAYQHQCETPQPDLETLNMLLPSRDEIFGAGSPRPLAPLRLRVRGEKDQPDQSHPDSAFPAGADGWHGCPAMRQSETWWMEELLRDALRQAGLLKLQGVRLDSKAARSHDLFFSEPSLHARRATDITILKTEAIGRLHEIIECLRRVLVLTRVPWQIHFTVEAEPDAHQWDQSWREEQTPEERVQDMLEEEREADRARQRHKLFLSDEHRLHLLEELGNSPAPGEFHPSQLPPPPAPAAEEAPENADPGEDEDEHWLPPAVISDPNEDWNSLFFMFTLTEDAAWMGRRNCGLKHLSHLLDLPPEYPPGTTPAEDADDID